MRIRRGFSQSSNVIQGLGLHGFVTKSLSRYLKLMRVFPLVQILHLYSKSLESSGVSLAHWIYHSALEIDPADPSASLCVFSPLSPLSCALSSLPSLWPTPQMAEQECKGHPCPGALAQSRRLGGSGGSQGQCSPSAAVMPYKVSTNSRSVRTNW